jgi:hypothetical protein
MGHCPDRTKILQLYDQCKSKLVQRLNEVAQLKQLQIRDSLEPSQLIELSAAVQVIPLLNFELDDYHKILDMMSDENFKTFVCADGRFIERVTGVSIVYRKWAPLYDSQECAPTSKFKEIFEENTRVVSMSTKAGRRTYLDLFLRDILARKEFSSYFRVFSGLQLSACNASAQLWGSADMVIGSSHCDEFSNHAPRNLHIVAVEASLSWCRESYWQCVAAAATLHKMLDGGEARRNVWGILSNGENWHFVFIDVNSHLWTSKVFRLDICHYSESDVDCIYQMIYHIVTSCFLERSDHK